MTGSKSLIKEKEMNSDEMYKVIDRIRRARGFNAKKAILVDFPEIKDVLKTTYDPYIQFGINPQPSWGIEYGEQQFSDKTQDILYDLIDGSLSGGRAVRVVKRHLNELTYESSQLLHGILSKNLKIGVAAKSINEVWPNLIPEFPIQLANQFLAKKCSFPCLISPKLDGLRAKWINGTFYSRRGHKFFGLTALEAEMHKVRAKAIEAFGIRDIEFDGELMIDGEHFNEISGKIRAFTEADSARYYIFDFPSMDKTPQFMRCARIDNLSLYFSGENKLNHITFVQHNTMMNINQVMEMYTHYLEEGYEGAMVKQDNGLYQNARTWDWMKLKNTETADCKVIGVFEGGGKYFGMCGGLIVEFGKNTVKVGSGLSDAQRMYWWNDPDEIIGRTVEVAYHEVTPDGSLRHPRLKGLRGDL